MRLQGDHHVVLRVPKPEEPCEAVAVSGRYSSVERCRQSLESLLNLPVRTDPLQQMMLAVPQSSYGTLIGERGATLHELMLDCRVLIEVPKIDKPGEVMIQGSAEGCMKAKL